MSDEKLLNTNKEDLVKIIKDCYSFTELLDKLEVENKKSLIYRLRRYVKKNDIKYDHFTKNKKTTDERWSEINIMRCVGGCKTYKEIMEKLGILPVTGSYITLKKYLHKYDIDFKPILISEKWSEENIKNIVNKSTTYKECLERLGIRAAGSNYKQLKKYIKLYNIDITHFDRNTTNTNTQTAKKPLSEILTENSNYNRASLKKRLYETGLKNRECEMCGQDENWNGVKISLILDHVNGVYNDNRIENLRIVCPNCNAGLPTHGGKNRKHQKKQITEYKCICGDKMDKKSSICNKCAGLKRRKVDRPPLEDLRVEADENGYSATGRKYGVSDNAIRKWISEK